jgi:glutathione S-transferase
VPADAYERARMHLVEDWADEALYFYGIYANLRLGGGITIPFLTQKLPPEIEAPLEANVRAYLEQILHWQGVGRYPAEKAEADLARALDALEAFVTRDGFAGGSALTLADLAVFAQLERYFLSGTHPVLAAQVRARNALVDWHRRVDAATSRPV